MNFPHEEYMAKVRGMTERELTWTLEDAQGALWANPEAEKSVSGWYADEINYCAMELARRAKVKVERNRKARMRRLAMNDVLDSLGMKRVRGAMGGSYIE